VEFDMAAKKRASRAAKPAGRKKKSKTPEGSKRVAKTRAGVPSTLAPEAARLQAALRDTIERDIADRIATHQREVVRLRAAMVARPEAPPPLMILAHGDSWFNYPLNGNSVEVPIRDTDIIAHLKKMGSPSPKILNISHFGDATTDEMGLQKQKRLIKALTTPENWLDGKPDAILFSGGGNDIAGDQFCIYLNYKDSGLPGLDADRFAGRLASMKASYLDLFLFRDRYANGVPIFGHGYDNAHPMQPHPPCSGPWMKPSLNFTGWNAEEGAAILLDALTRFRSTLTDLEGSPKNFDFTVVHTEGTLAKEDWANELHPYPPGFAKLADKFLAKLRDRFRGRL
jgi:hypothetical protein